LQEQTLPFGIKLLGVCLCLFLLSGWCYRYRFKPVGLRVCKK
ncbi:hypothetical protein GFK27_20300, partial [Salmonella enterica subsp. enterica serovar Enteritidis]|nr:hypothetical protein [Salmonella enterica subsp. enterica serovar Enteritidis]